MKQYKIGVFFEKGYLVSSQINLVTEDYKSTEFIFEFDIEEGRKVFELKKPDGSKYIKDIINNKITLVDYDTELNEISLIPIAGTYEFEIVNYTEDSKLTLQEHGYFEVRGEIVEVNDSEVEKDTRLPILDSLINDVEGLKTDINSSVKNSTEQATYAKVQGDYAKEQAQIIIDANTTATKIINDFETNVDEYTTDFNTNAEDKLEAYNQNDIDKTKAYNENAESKENSYNENASDILKEYNDNATTKLSEYNANSETKTTAFDTNASEKTDAFNLNATNKTTDFDSNAEAKTTEFNDNATTKTEEYNTNAEAKVNEFNATVDELKQDVEDCYNNMLTNEVEGTSIHVEDSANARILSLESEGNCVQVTTTGKNKLDFNALVANVDFVTKNNDGSYSVTGNGSAVSVATIDYELEAGTYYISADYTNSKDLVNSETGNLLAFNMTLEDGTSQWVSLIRTDDVAGTRRSVKFVLDKKVTRIHLQTFERFTSGTITFKNVQIGSDSEYEPYTGGQPSPSPDYPQDVEVIEAYNLFDKNTAINGQYFNDSGNIVYEVESFVSDYIEVDSKNYILSVDVSDCALRICVYDENKNFIRRLTSTGKSDLSIQIAENERYVTLSSNRVENKDTMRFLKGTTPKPYVPYKNIGIKTTGKNLCDGINQNYYLNIDCNISGKTSGNTGLAISTNGATKFTVSTKITQSRFRVACTNELPTDYLAINVYNGLNHDKKNQSMIIDTTGYKYLIVNATDLNEIMIEQGNVATPYEPYHENTVDVNLQGNFIGKIGDVADTLRVDNGRAILTKRIGMSIFDGSEYWNLTNNVFYTNALNDYYLSDGTLKCLSNYYVGFSEVNGSSIAYNNGNNSIALRNKTTGSSLFIRDDRFTTVEEFKTWLSENPVTVYYVLAEPYEVDLGEVKMPKTFEGVTNISLISTLDSDMKLKYVRSTNIVVDNLAKAIVALGGEINV